MPWVVDTCLVIDVLDADPEYGAISADLLDGMSTEGLRFKRSGEVSRRPVADLLIGAFSMRFDGLLTRNAGDFTRLFPDLVIHEPSTRPPNLSQ